MAIFRVTKNNNYTVISNHYLKDKNLSLKTIGLFTLILSLPTEFDYSIDNLSKLTNESYRSIKLLLNELKNNGYLVISKKRNDKGLYNYEYIFFESNTINPNFSNPVVKNYTVDSDNNSNKCNTFSQNPEDISPLLVKEPLYINTIDNKINIDKTKLNLCFLTEALVDLKFIELNNIDIFSYDYFLTDLLNKENYKDVICVVNYVVKHIMNNKYNDENNNPILNLLSYFKSSVITNLDNYKIKKDPHLFDDWGL